MKYVVARTAKRKNAKRHAITEFGRIKYFNSLEEARERAKRPSKYVNEIYTSKWEFVEKVN